VDVLSPERLGLDVVDGPMFGPLLREDVFDRISAPRYLRLVGAAPECVLDGLEEHSRTCLLEAAEHLLGP